LEVSLIQEIQLWEVLTPRELMKMVDEGRGTAPDGVV
jgi:hypothetical protein